MKTKKPLKKVSEVKVKTVKELTDLLKTKKSFLIASIKDIPSSQFQEISKNLRGKTIIKVPKKSLILRAVENSEKEEIKKLKGKIDKNFALLFSDLDPFELALELVNNKSPSRAKPGQIALEDIEIPAGPTDLIPGPAISELGALGIEIQIQGGKIEIRKPKVIVKKGDKISQAASEIMAKLDIKPFSTGFSPIAALDNKTNVVYLSININKEETLQNLKKEYSKAFSFSINLGYINKETIGFLIRKAIINKIAIENLLNKNNNSPEEKNSDGGEN